MVGKYKGRRINRIRPYRPGNKRYAMQKTRRIVRGHRFRFKAKSKRYHRFNFYDVIKPSHNMDRQNVQGLFEGNAVALFNPMAAIGAPAAPGQVLMDQESRSNWFGPVYDAGAVGALDGCQNPQQVGNGLLAEVNRRDSTMDASRWDYSGSMLRERHIINAWNAVNNIGGGLFNVPIAGIFVKGVKVSVQGRSKNHPGLMYLMYRKNPNDPVKFKETIGMSKAYFPARKVAAGWVPGVGLPNIKWEIPQIWIGGYTYSRIRYTIFYKIRSGALPS